MGVGRASMLSVLLVLAALATSAHAHRTYPGAYTLPSALADRIADAADVGWVCAIHNPSESHAWRWWTVLSSASRPGRTPDTPPARYAAGACAVHFPDAWADVGDCWPVSAVSTDDFYVGWAAPPIASYFLRCAEAGEGWETRGGVPGVCATRDACTYPIALRLNETYGDWATVVGANLPLAWSVWHAAATARVPRQGSGIFTTTLPRPHPVSPAWRCVADDDATVSIDPFEYMVQQEGGEWDQRSRATVLAHWAAPHAPLTHCAYVWWVDAADPVGVGVGCWADAPISASRACRGGADGLATATGGWRPCRMVPGDDVPWGTATGCSPDANAALLSAPDTERPGAPTMIPEAACVHSAQCPQLCADFAAGATALGLPHRDALPLVGSAPVTSQWMLGFNCFGARPAVASATPLWVPPGHSGGLTGPPPDLWDAGTRDQTVPPVRDAHQIVGAPVAGDVLVDFSVRDAQPERIVFGAPPVPCPAGTYASEAGGEHLFYYRNREQLRGSFLACMDVSGSRVAQSTDGGRLNEGCAGTPVLTHPPQHTAARAGMAIECHQVDATPSPVPGECALDLDALRYAHELHGTYTFSIPTTAAYALLPPQSRWPTTCAQGLCTPSQCGWEYSHHPHLGMHVWPACSQPLWLGFADPLHAVCMRLDAAAPRLATGGTLLLVSQLFTDDPYAEQGAGNCLAGVVAGIDGAAASCVATYAGTHAAAWWLLVSGDVVGAHAEDRTTPYPAITTGFLSAAYEEVPIDRGIARCTPSCPAGFLCVEEASVDCSDVTVWGYGEGVTLCDHGPFIDRRGFPVLCPQTNQTSPQGTTCEHWARLPSHAGLQCTPCAEGTACSALGAHAPTPCPDGFICRGGIPPFGCPPNYKASAAGAWCEPAGAATLLPMPSVLAPVMLGTISTNTLATHAGSLPGEGCAPGTLVLTKYNVGAARVDASEQLSLRCIACPLGAACPDWNTYTPTLCAPGTGTSPDGTRCVPCASQNGTARCDAGTRYHNEAGVWSATPVGALRCGPGTYDALSPAGLRECALCPAGSYCLQCPAGSHTVLKTSGGVSWTECAPCMHVGVCPLTPAERFVCPPGTYAGATGATNVRECTVCTDAALEGMPGLVCPGTGHTSCCDTAGTCPTYVTAPLLFGGITPGRTGCGPCDAGVVRAGGCAASAYACPVGYFCPTTAGVPGDPSTQVRCPRGALCDSTGAIAPRLCPTPSCAHGACAALGVTIALPRMITLGNDTSDSSACAFIPAGYGACPGLVVGADLRALDAVCGSCPAGAWSAKGAASCDACGAGYWCAGRGAPRVACPVGTNSSALRATSAATCGACPSGHLCAAPATALPIRCPLGTWASRGSTAATCPPCDPGFLCSSGRRAPCAAGTTSVDAMECTQCLLGTYCPSYGPHNATLALPCPGGAIAAGLGLTDASACSTTPCTAGAVCPAGASAPIDCSTAPGAWAPSPDALACATCPLGSWCALGTAHACPAGTLWNGTGGVSQALACLPCPTGHECDGGHVRACIAEGCAAACMPGWGYVGNGTCAPCGSCTADPAGLCVGLDNATAACWCPQPGRASGGPTCTTAEPGWAVRGKDVAACPAACSGRGNCSWRHDAPTPVCTCEAGADGLACAACAPGWARAPGGTSKCTKCPEACSAHGRCVWNGSAPVCECAPRWRGEACDACVAWRADPASDCTAVCPGCAADRGECRRLPGLPTPACVCSGNWTGFACTHATNTTAVAVAACGAGAPRAWCAVPADTGITPSPCNASGSVVRTSRADACDCQTGWRGPTCALSDACSTRECGAGRCDGSGCTCVNGWSGSACAVLDDACVATGGAVACAPHSCRVVAGAPVCVCDAGGVAPSDAAGLGVPACVADVAVALREETWVV